MVQVKKNKQTNTKKRQKKPPKNQQKQTYKTKPPT